jgi:hypothetical protein
VDAADIKGDPIHQQLMPKKMQKLDESTDFRPFKFRIQAFTAAFLEEARVYLPFLSNSVLTGSQLADQGYPEEKIPMKKVGESSSTAGQGTHWPAGSKLSLAPAINFAVQ